MDYYNKNLALLKKRQGSLAQAIVDYNQDSQRLEVLPTKNNSFTVKKTFSEGEKTVSCTLHSVYDPEKEAQQAVAGYKIRKYANIAVLGLGFAYHVKEICKQYKDFCDFILVIEKDMELFKLGLRCIDFSDILDEENIFFAVAEEPMTIFRFLQGKAISMMANDLDIVKHEASFKTAAGYYQEIIAKIQEVGVWTKVNVIAQVKTTDTYYKNIFLNIPEMLHIPGVKHLFGAFKDVPVVIVAAGPSLNKNIDYLRKVAEKFLLIAVDTALRVLTKHGIKPHIVVSIDYTPDNLRYFAGAETKDTYLIVDPEVYPEILKSYQGPKFVINLWNKSLCEWLTLKGVDKGVLPKGLSVAHTCLLLAREFGCDPVVFIGQDLAFSSGITHSRDTVMSRKIDVDRLEEGTVKVKDIFGKEILTATSMLVFLKHFEEMLFDLPCACIDATEGGARIKGTELKPLREVIYQYRDKQKADLRAILQKASLSLEKVEVKKLVRDIDSLRVDLDNLKQNCAYGGKLLEDIIEILNRAQVDKGRLVKSCNKWADISKDIYAKREMMLVLRDNITDALVLQGKRMYNLTDIDNIEDEEKKREIRTALERDKLFYERLESSAEFVLAHFKELKKNLKG